MSRSARVRQRVRIARVRVRFIAEGREGIGHLRNVSRAGLFVRASELPRAGAVVALQFRSPLGELIDLRGEVRWNTRGLPANDVAPGFGVLVQEPPREFRAFFLWALGQAEKEEPEE